MNNQKIVNLFRIKNLGCDSSGCFYFGKFVPLSNSADLLEQECPKCSKILLTREDYDSLTNLVILFIKTKGFVFNLLIHWLKFLGKFYDVELSGNGELKLGNMKIRPNQHDINIR